MVGFTTNISMKFKTKLRTNINIGKGVILQNSTEANQSSTNVLKKTEDVILTSKLPYVQNISTVK